MWLGFLSLIFDREPKSQYDYYIIIYFKWRVKQDMTSFKHLLKTFIVALAAVIVGITGYQLLKDKPVVTPVQSETVQTEVAKPKATETRQVFTKTQIEQATKRTLKVKTIEEMQLALSKPNAWETLGFDQDTAKRIANRFTESKQQAQSILREMATEQDEHLQVIILEKTVNIGTVDSDKDVAETEAAPTALKTALGEITELDVEFNFGPKELDFSWEVEDNQTIESSYENDLTKEYLSGKEAQVFVEKIVAGIDFQSASKEKVYQAISKKLNLKTKNLNSFKYEVTYTDDSKIENKLNF